MMVWEERPEEIANLLNPAFCGEIMCQAVKEYREISEKPFPFALSFLVLPLVLHPYTRDKITMHSRIQLHTWVESHQDIRVGFSERTRFLRPITREVLMFLLHTKTISLDREGNLTLLKRKKGYSLANHPTDTKEIYSKSKIVGRWFARAGPPSNVFSILGVKP